MDVIEYSKIIHDFPESLVNQYDIKTDAGILSLIQNLKSLSLARELSRISLEIKNVLNSEDGIVSLQTTIQNANSWRRFTPIEDTIPNAKNLENLTELYRKNFITEQIFFERKDWLRVLFSYEDYETLHQLIGMHVNRVIIIKSDELVLIRDNIMCYPLTVFSSIWTAIGEIEDFVTILRYRNFRARDKERYILPLLGNVVLTKEQHILLLEESLQSAPMIFSELYFRNVDLGQQVLNQEIIVDEEISLVKLQCIEASISNVLEPTLATKTTKEFAFRLVEDRIRGQYNRDTREIAWKFLSTYLDVDEDRDFLLKLKSWETPDNRLWLVSKLTALL